MRRSFMNMNKIFLAVTLLVSARVFAGQEVVVAPSAPTPEVAIGFLGKVNGHVTTARLAVIKALGSAWSAVPTSLKTGTTSALNWTSDKVQRVTPNFVSSAFGWVKNQCGKAKNIVASYTPETVKKIVTNSNVQFVVGTTAALTAAGYLTYKLVKYATSDDDQATQNNQKQTTPKQQAPAKK